METVPLPSGNILVTHSARLLVAALSTCLVIQSVRANARIHRVTINLSLASLGSASFLARHTEKLFVTPTDFLTSSQDRPPRSGRRQGIIGATPRPVLADGVSNGASLVAAVRITGASRCRPSRRNYPRKRRVRGYEHDECRRCAGSAACLAVLQRSLARAGLTGILFFYRIFRVRRFNR